MLAISVLSIMALLGLTCFTVLAQTTNLTGVSGTSETQAGGANQAGTSAAAGTGTTDAAGEVVTPATPSSPTASSVSTSAVQAGNASLIGNASQNYIRVRDQQVASEGPTAGTVLIDEASIAVPGWVDIHNSDGDSIGYTQIQPGLNENIRVRIDMNLATSTLQAMLHNDTSRMGIFEFIENPTVDLPTAGNQSTVAPYFNATFEGRAAGVSGNQTGATGSGNMMANASGTTAALGNATAGAVTTNVGVANDIAAGSATTGNATMGNNASGSGVANIGVTENASMDNAMPTAANQTGVTGTSGAGATNASTAVASSSAAAGTAGGSQGVRADDQSINNAQITVAEANSDVQGWIVVLNDANGNPDTTKVLGYAPLSAGTNSGVVVTLGFLNRTSPTSTLWAQLHRDGGRSGVFEYPGADVPLRYQNGSQVMTSFRVMDTQGTGSAGTSASGTTGTIGTTGTAGTGAVTGAAANAGETKAAGSDGSAGTTGSSATADSNGDTGSSGLSTTSGTDDDGSE